MPATSSEPRPEVVVVGAAGLDTCVYPPVEAWRLDADAYYTRTLDGVGQAGGYASRGYAALGYRTAYVGALADDPPGREVRRVLSDEGIDTSWCFDDPAGTARSVNLVGADGRRVAFYDGRGNPSLVPDLAGLPRLLTGAALCHVNVPNWARQVVPMAREAGVPVLADLQDVRSPEDVYRLDFVDGADVLCFSAAHLGDPEPAMHAYWQRRPGAVQLCGMGAQGCAVGVQGRVWRLPAPQLDLPVVDTNGAGDALAVGLATAFVLDGRDIDVAVRRGQVAARITCSQWVPKGPLATRELVRQWGAG